MHNCIVRPPVTHHRQFGRRGQFALTELIANVQIAVFIFAPSINAVLLCDIICRSTLLQCCLDEATNTLAMWWAGALAQETSPSEQKQSYDTFFAMSDMMGPSDLSPPPTEFEGAHPLPHTACWKRPPSPRLSNATRSFVLL